jgi:hypothetical protein
MQFLILVDLFFITAAEEDSAKLFPKAVKPAQAPGNQFVGNAPTRTCPSGQFDARNRCKTSW